MREKPPCKVDGIECPTRHNGCRDDCEAYFKWLTAHNAEMEAKRNYKAREADISNVEVNRSLRKRMSIMRKRTDNRRNRK